MKETDSKQGCLAVKPANISYEEATSAAYGGLLALQYMESGHIQPGDKALVYGASGTSGTVAVQYAKHLGAEVTAVCSAANADFVKALGADKTLDYTNAECVSMLESYDFVLDAVGKNRTSELKEACRRQMAQRRVAGRDTFVSIDDGALLLESERLDKMRELVEAGFVTPVNDRSYPLEQIVDAHRYVELGHKRGNVAITVNEVT
jgi:NADPH:quinone reductase-like Zn-dependent oxidoreductase